MGETSETQPDKFHCDVSKALLFKVETTVSAVSDCSLQEESAPKNNKEFGSLTRSE